MVPEETLERAAVDDVSPRYLRKQKPAEVKRKRTEPLGSRWRRGLAAFALVVGVSGAVGWCAYLLWFSPATRLAPTGIEVRGEHFVSRTSVVSVFAPDLGRSVLRVPLDRRLDQIETIPWVRQADVERVLPDRLVVQIEERQPVAFLHSGAGMKLIDADGVILNPPAGARFNLPVISGINRKTPVAERARRVALFSDFLRQIRAVRPDAAADVSQANLANSDDIQATLTNLPVLAGQGPVVVDFGNSNFAGRFRVFLDNFPSWEAKAGNVEAVDLRYDGQALVTPGPQIAASRGAARSNPAPRARPVAAPSAPAPQRSMQATASTRKGTERR
jgi:cell division protein FtsQ